MKKSRKDVELGSITFENFHGRFAPVDQMVIALYSEIEADGYAIMLRGFREDYQPSGWEEKVVERLADAACRMRGCFYLETKILNDNMELSIAEGESRETAVGSAFMRDFNGPKLLSKLSRYGLRLQKESSMCIRILSARRASRRREQEMTAATMARLKPCTSVIQ